MAYLPPLSESLQLALGVIHKRRYALVLLVVGKKYSPVIAKDTSVGRIYLMETSAVVNLYGCYISTDFLPYIL